MDYSKSDSYAKRKRIFALFKLILLVLFIAGIPAFLYYRFGPGVFSKDAAANMIEYIREHSAEAALIIIGLQAVQVIVCFLPGQPIQFAASYTFGLFRAFCYSIAGAMVGVTISFFVSRLLGRDAMHVLFGEEAISSYQARLNSARGIMIVFCIYLIPGIPKDIVSYAAGVSEIRFRPFLIASSIGRCPGMLGSLLLGHFVNTKNYPAIAALGIATVVMLAVFFFKRKDLMAFIDNVEQTEQKRKDLK